MSAGHDHVRLQVGPGPTEQELVALLERAGLTVDVSAAEGEPILAMEDVVIRGAADIRTFAYIAGVNLSQERAQRSRRRMAAG